VVTNLGLKGGDGKAKYYYITPYLLNPFFKVLLSVRRKEKS
jgi:hypothetical protein